MTERAAPVGPIIRECAKRLTGRTVSDLAAVRTLARFIPAVTDEEASGVAKALRAEITRLKVQPVGGLATKVCATLGAMATGLEKRVESDTTDADGGKKVHESPFSPTAARPSTFDSPHRF